MKTSVGFNKLKILLVLALMFSSYGCSSSNDYITEYDSIKTTQFNALSGKSGIYWSSNNSLVFSGVRPDGSEFGDYGVFELDLDTGENKKIIGYKEGRLRTYYCLSGRELYLEVVRGEAFVENPSANFNVVIYKRTKSEGRSHYSVPQCKKVFYPPNAKKGAYWPLLAGDGFIYRNIPNSRNEILEMPAELVDKKGVLLKELDIANRHAVSPSYSAFNDAYYARSRSKTINKENKTCFLFWVLERKNWDVLSKELCFGDWYTGSSIKLFPTKAGHFVEYHGSTEYTGFLKTDKTLYEIGRGQIRASAVSPDGCRVAYATGALKGSKNLLHRSSQIINVFDLCGFVKDKEGESF